MRKPIKSELPLSSTEELAVLARQLEDCSLPYVHWTHRSHLAIGLHYLSTLHLEQALERTREAILRYNLSRGDSEGYHETITRFFLHLIHHFLQANPELSLPECLRTLSPSCTMTTLEEYYSAARLFTPLARTTWVEPDIKKLDRFKFRSRRNPGSCDVLDWSRVR